MPAHPRELVGGRYRMLGEPEASGPEQLVADAEDVRLGRRVVLVLGDEGTAPPDVREQTVAERPDARVLDGGRVGDRAYVVLQPPEPEPRTAVVAPVTSAAEGSATAPTEVVPALAGAAASARGAPRDRRRAELLLALGLIVLIAALAAVLLWPAEPRPDPVIADPNVTTTTFTTPTTTPTTVPSTTTVVPTTPTTTAPTTTRPPPRERDRDRDRDRDEKGDQDEGDQDEGGPGGGPGGGRGGGRRGG